MADRVTALAEEIRSASLSFGSANDLDAMLRGLAGIPEAVADRFRRFGDELDDRANLDPGCAEAIREAASGITGIAKRLDEVTGCGLMKRGSPGRPSARPSPAAPAPSPSPRKPEPPARTRTPARPRTAARKPPRDEPGGKPTAARPWVTGPAPLPVVVTRPANPSGYPATPPAQSPGGLPKALRPSRRQLRKRARRARRAWRRARWN
jgi:hypothetical protein